MKCRICKQEIGRMGWSKHVLKHKREFCKVIDRFEGEAHNINWEDVVLYYNPKEANFKKCIGYDIPKVKTLQDFLNKEKFK